VKYAAHVQGQNIADIASAVIKPGRPCCKEGLISKGIQENEVDPCVDVNVRQGQK